MTMGWIVTEAGNVPFSSALEVLDNGNVKLLDGTWTKTAKAMPYYPAIMPAQAGTFVVRVEADTEWLTPVISWAIDPLMFPIPMTMDGVSTDTDGVRENEFILHPTGVCTKGESLWRTPEDAVADFRAQIADGKSLTYPRYRGGVRMRLARRRLWRPATLNIGDRVCAKVRTASGWKGVGTVTEVAGDLVSVRGDDGHSAMFLRDQVAKVRANGDEA